MAEVDEGDLSLKPHLQSNHHLEKNPEPDIAAVSCASSPVLSPGFPEHYSQTPTMRSHGISPHGSGSKSPYTPSSMLPSPLRTPVRRAINNIKTYLEDVGHLAKFNKQDAWLPITESRTGNAFYAIFHNLNAGIGFQGLLLPYAMYYLGWTWGLLSIITAYVWQLYTTWILVHLHEAVPGVRHDRYVQLAQSAFGEKLGYWLAMPPNLNLTAGTSCALIVLGGGTLKLFYKIVCAPDCGESPLTSVEWYLVFSTFCAVLAQLPNLNSIVGLSMVGALTAVTYCTMLWTLSISTARPPGVSYNAELGSAMVTRIFTVLNALGIVAFSFRGHNVCMEIQATMPSTLKRPSHVAMWRGAKVTNAIIAACYLPIAVAGFWAFGSTMLSSGILASIYVFHQSDISRPVMGLLFIMVVINSLTSFQMYSFTIFDIFEASYTEKRNKPISKHVRVISRTFYVFICFLIAVAFPWMSSLSGLLGGLSSAPVTFAYPCFMWLAIKQPEPYSFSWYLNWTLGLLGILMGVAFTAGGIWSIVHYGITFHFFQAS